MGLEFVLSQKNAKLLLSKGFLFSKNGQSSSKVRWRCIEHGNSCLGKAHTSSQESDGNI